MKFKIAFFLVLCSIFRESFLFAGDFDQRKIEKLEEQAEYQIASEMLIRNAQEEYSSESLKLLFDFNQKHLVNLKKNIFFHEPMSVDCLLQEELQKNQNGKQRKLLEKLKDSLPLIVTSAFLLPLGRELIVYPIVAKDVVSNNLEYDEIEQKLINDLNIPLVSKKDVIANLSLYDILKINTRFLLASVSAKIKDNLGYFDDNLSFLKKIRAFKEDLVKSRTQYLSFVVVSPYLAEAQRQMLLADHNYMALRLKNKQKLTQAVLALSDSCHKKWLYQTDETVRMQFIAVQMQLKRIASKNEIDEFKMLTTLSDSLDPSKVRGAQAWFE